MKKIFIFLLIFFTANCTFAEDKININDYLNKSYVGTPYTEAIKSETPFLLIFANPSDLISIAKLARVGEMVYNDFKNQYNFCILNTKNTENSYLLKFFNPQYLPSLYIVNPQKRSYSFIERKFYNRKAIKKILTDYNNY